MSLSRHFGQEYRALRSMTWPAVLIAVLVIGAALLAFSFVPIQQSLQPRNRVQISMLNVLGQPFTAAEGWQQWHVTYVDGSTQDFQSDSVQIPAQAGIVATSQPGWMDVIINLRLTAQLSVTQCIAVLPASGIGCQFDGRTITTFAPVAGYLQMSPLLLVMRNNSALPSQQNLNPITFTPNDPIGTVKSWYARIQFSGTPPSSTGGGYATVVDLSNYLAGYQSANILVGMNMLVQFSYANWNTACNCPDTAFFQWTNLVSQSAVTIPYSIFFNWNPLYSGGITITVPTGIVTTTASVILIAWTYTQTQTLVFPQPATTVTVILSGPGVPVTYTITTIVSRTGTGTTGGISTTYACQAIHTLNDFTQCLQSAPMLTLILTILAAVVVGLLIILIGTSRPPPRRR